MYKKQISYTDYNGDAQKGDYYFNLSRFDLMKLNRDYKEAGGLENAFNRAVKLNDSDAMGEIFTNLILSSYGKKSEDGQHFKKSYELTEEFVSSAAFEALFDELTTNEGALLEFFNGIVPANMRNMAAPLA